MSSQPSLDSRHQPSRRASLRHLGLLLLAGGSAVAVPAWADAPPAIAPGASTEPVKLQEGFNYRLVTTDVVVPKGKILIQEMFWYGCPHCFHLEPHLVAWRKTLPANVDFEPYAVPISPGWVPLTRAFFAAKFMGVLERTHDAVFNDIHVKNMRPITEDQIADMYADLGVNRDQFIQMYNSFGVDNAVRQAGNIAQQAGVHGVPAILINGKYLLDGEMLGSNEAMLPVADAFIAKISHEMAAKK